MPKVWNIKTECPSKPSVSSLTRMNDSQLFVGVENYKPLLSRENSMFKNLRCTYRLWILAVPRAPIREISDALYKNSCFEIAVKLEHNLRRLMARTASGSEMNAF
jgi:hypothetical protein